MGVFDLDGAGLSYIHHLEGCVDMFRTLDKSIKRYHPDWVIDEVYWRGVDLAEGITDEIIEGLTPAAVHRALKVLVQNLNHHPKIVVISHSIGKKFLVNPTKKRV